MNPELPSQKIDSLLPPAMAQKAESVGVQKARLNGLTVLLLAILAGAFIALGAALYTAVTADLIAHVPYGLVKLIGGLVFCLGLILVIVGGAELFTGNALIVMAWASNRISFASLMKNWMIVYIGNFIGAIGTVFLIFFTKQHFFNNGEIGLQMLNIAQGKCQLGFGQAIALGVMCNTLVCLAVWLCLSARSTTDKILSIIFPITAFVALGFEHSIANMYFVPAGLFIKDWASPDFWNLISSNLSNYDNLTWAGFFVDNLIPVTIGNIIGGGVLVGGVYWLIYSRNQTDE